MNASRGRSGAIGLLVVILTAAASASAEGDDGWIDLIASEGFAAWKPPAGEWVHTASVKLDPADARKFAYEAGPGALIVNGPKGRTRNLLSVRDFGDIELHMEFNVPKGSNSGVKFQGVYEIQISDSQGAKVLKATHCGGIYPRSEMKPIYHHIDEGIPPKVNAAGAAGEWQTLDVTFHAPRIDADGKKTADARIVKATLNGQTIHEDVALKTPTGDNWRKPEVAAGPLLLQADHGPVAFRNIRVRPLPSPAKP